MAGASTRFSLQIFPKEQLTLDKKPLNTGNFGMVYKGQLKLGVHSELTVAVKVPKKISPSFYEEMERLAGLKHPHVIAAIGICHDKGGSMIIMDLMATDLRTELTQFNGPSAADSNEELKQVIPHLVRILGQVAYGMAYLHSIRIVHRDLAARNVLLSSEDLPSAIAKIGDFGLSRSVYHKGYYRPGRDADFPLPWCAPEVLPPVVGAQNPAAIEKNLIDFGEASTSSAFIAPTLKHEPKSDIWSYGVVIWEVITRGEAPFEDLAFTEIITLVKQNRKTLTIPEQHEFPKKLEELMLHTWQYEPENRPSFVEIAKIVDQLSAADPVPNSSSPSSSRSAYGLKVRPGDINVQNPAPPAPIPVTSYDMQNDPITYNSDPALDREHKVWVAALSSPRVKEGFWKRLEPKDIATALLVHDCLQYADVERIDSQVVREDRVKQLTQILSSKTRPGWGPKLVKCLKEQGYTIDAEYFCQAIEEKDQVIPR